MKIEDTMLYMVECYLNNEIENINNNIIEEDNLNVKKDLEKDLKYLEDLTTDDLNKITKMCFDEEFINEIYDNINYYLYHYKYTKNEE